MATNIHRGCFPPRLQLERIIQRWLKYFPFFLSFNHGYNFTRMTARALYTIYTNYAFTTQQQTYRYNYSDNNKNKENLILLKIVNINVLFNNLN